MHGFLCVCPSVCLAELPQIEQFHFNPNGVNGGQAVRVMCMVTSGDLPIDIYWLKDGRPLLRSIYHKIDEYTLILSLRQTTISDSGNYTCVASNAAGLASRWSTLKVKGINRVFYLLFSTTFSPDLYKVLFIFCVLTCPETKDLGNELADKRHRERQTYKTVRSFRNLR